MKRLHKELLVYTILGLIIGVLVAMLKSDNFTCEQANYDMRIVSWDPLILHLENFITPRERRMLKNLGQPNLQKSQIIFTNGTAASSDVRTSSTAILPPFEPVVKCVRERMASFEGYVNVNDIDDFQVTWYEAGQEFKDHLDRQPNSTTMDKKPWKRTTTGFATLDADCDKCGTKFPLIKARFADQDHKWCRILDCEESVLTVKPIPGSMLFWQNIQKSGEVDRRMVHAGLPVPDGGFKVGLNIWTEIDPSNGIIR